MLFWCWISYSPGTYRPAQRNHAEGDRQSSYGWVLWRSQHLHAGNLIHQNIFQQLSKIRWITFPKTNIAHARRPSQKELSLPTIYFQGLRYVSFRGYVWLIQVEHQHFRCQFLSQAAVSRIIPPYCSFGGFALTGGQVPTARGLYKSDMTQTHKPTKWDPSFLILRTNQLQTIYSDSTRSYSGGSARHIWRMNSNVRLKYWMHLNDQNLQNVIFLNCDPVSNLPQNLGRFSPAHFFFRCVHVYVHWVQHGTVLYGVKTIVTSWTKSIHRYRWWLDMAIDTSKYIAWPVEIDLLKLRKLTHLAPIGWAVTTLTYQLENYHGGFTFVKNREPNGCRRSWDSSLRSSESAAIKFHWDMNRLINQQQL